MRYLSVCAGIEAATVAWHHMGWEAAGFSEIEKFPSQVLDYHYPNVPKLGDMTKYKEWDIGTIDLLVGGTPCQSFSVAGLRKGMADPRGNLALTFLAIADHYKPKWIVWENVPGVLSSNKGKDFESFLDGLEELGYILDCDILDAQFHGVAQRRRRVFVCAQHRDYLLKNKTSSSALTIAQCWQEILLSLLAKAWSESGKEQQNLGLPFLSNDGAIRRMRLFGLAGETDCYEILRENLVEAFLKLPPDQSDWDAVHGKLGKEPMQADLWTDFPKDDLSTLTEQSLKKALDESYEVMKSCITSTTTNSITTFQIYTSFRAALVIAKLIQRLNPSFPPFWSAATSALTAIQEYTNYARQTDSKLLGEVVGIQDWLYLIEQAERTAESLGDIAVECFGKVFPVSQSLCGDIKASKVKREDIAATIAARFGVSRNNYEELAPSQQVYENHGTDSRIKPVDVCPTVTSRWGTGGNNVPLVDSIKKFDNKNNFELQETVGTLCADSHPGSYSGQDAYTGRLVPTYSMQGNLIGRDKGGPQGIGVAENAPMYTLNATDVHGVAQPIAYSFDSLASNSMKSNNPHSGCRPVELSKTLDTTTPEPSKNQGGIAVMQPIPLNTMTMQGRPSDTGRMGSGIGSPGDPCPTLTKGHSHAVAQVVHGTQDPCVSDIAFAQGRNNGGENVLFQSMAVRRLTPVECERLQGFPDNYTDIQLKGKPTPDGPRYKALGNSMAVPVMKWIGERINMVEK